MYVRIAFDMELVDIHVHVNVADPERLSGSRMKGPWTSRRARWCGSRRDPPTWCRSLQDRRRCAATLQMAPMPVITNNTLAGSGTAAVNAVGSALRPQRRGRQFQGVR